MVIYGYLIILSVPIYYKNQYVLLPIANQMHTKFFWL